MRNYTRWREAGSGLLAADIMGSKIQIYVDCVAGSVSIIPIGDVSTLADMGPDEVRMYGVRLIEAAALADGNRAIRRAPANEGNTP